MLTKYGQSVTLRPYSAGGGDYNPSTGAAAPSGPEGALDETRKALTADQPGSQIQRHFGQTNQTDTLIQTGEKWVYLDANGRAPCLQDHVLINSIDYVVIGVQVTDPGGVPLFYLLILRT